MNKPIIVFDSGFGGISVLKRLVEKMPNEDYLYYGDSANAPYGPRTTAEVQQLTLGAIAEASKGVEPKAIVIACNTATVATHELLQQTYPHIPVIGILAAVELAAQAKDHPRVLALATAGTIASATFRNTLERVGDSADVVALPAPAIVHYVENAMKDRAALKKDLATIFAPYMDKPFDSVVLGCTHFPFAADVIAEVLGYPVDFFDGSALTVRQTEEALAKNNTRNAQEYSGSLKIINSGNRQDLVGFAWTLFCAELKV
jgi:glutamate racemase